MLNHWNETLENLSKDTRKDKFRLVFNGTIYEVSLSYALGISSIISERYQKDPTYNMFNLNINIQNMDDKQLQGEFFNFIHGQKISKELYLEIAFQLKNKKMIKKYNKNRGLKTESIIRCIKEYHKMSDMKLENIKEELEYVGNHLEQVKEDIQILTDEELLFILNTVITVENEGILWNIVKERIQSKYSKKESKDTKNEEENKIGTKNNQDNDENQKTINKSLFLSIIQPNYLNKTSFEEYLEMIEEEDIEKETKIFQNIKKILMKNLYNLKFDQLSFNGTKIDHERGKDFDGIIRYLQKKYGDDLTLQGIISISASSTEYNSPEKVIDYEWKDFWNSNIDPGNWLEFDFKDLMIRLEGYSLKTENMGPNCWHLRNWVIEGSNDKKTWSEIDKEEKNNDLNGKSYHHYFPISNNSQEFRYIRIRSIGRSHYGDKYNTNDHHLLLCNIEFYGEIISH